MTIKMIERCLAESKEVLEKFAKSPINLSKLEQSISILANALKNNNCVFSCGNGGSYCDSMHFAEELTGKFKKDRPPMKAMHLGDGGHLTCVTNDYGPEFVFSRLLEAFGRRGDVLLAISTSGNSKNVLEAVKFAKGKGISTIALTGKSGGELANMAEVSLVIPSESTERIQEMHIKIIHLFVEGIERKIYPQNYI